jgi:hypothetical protein
MKRPSLVLAFAIGLAMPSFAQDLKLPALSPGAKISQDFSTSNIEISYSRPSMRGRKVFGEVVPFGSVWRTGANSATKVKFGEDVTLGGVEVKAGEYALYTIPNSNEWEVILNKGTGNWGNAGYNTDEDIARFKVKPTTLASTVSSFTIEIANITFNSCTIDLQWEKTGISIPVKANNEARLSASIDKAINTPNIPYWQAANYYFETNQKPEVAYEYVNKAVEQNPKAFYMWHMKAKMAMKLGKKAEAKEAAEKSIETAKGSAFEADYVRNNQKILDDLKKM